MADNKTIHIDPVTRIEGHLKAEVTYDNGVVTDAKLSGGMFRGFEHILKGRDPRDAPQITQRICGVCPASHAIASSSAIENLAGVHVPTNGRVTRNLIQGANYLQSHILHFYHLAGQDFIQGPNTPPFAPRFEDPDLRLDSKTNQVGVDQYLEALDVRRTCHEMVALFAGRMPHLHGVMPGGVSEIPSKEKITEYAARFKGVRKFVEEKYIPIVYLVASAYKNLSTFGQGNRNCLSYGVFPTNDDNTEFYFKPGAYYNGKDQSFDIKRVTEQMKYSWFKEQKSGNTLTDMNAIPDLKKETGYSFCKAPRYDGQPMEVGPMARMWISNREISPTGQKLLKQYFNVTAKNFRDLGEDLAFSLMGRHIARVEETWHLLDIVETNLKQVKFDEPTFVEISLPQEGFGFGLTEAPRGSLVHYIKTSEGLIDDYQLLPATLWNMSPRDDNDVRGPIEEALIGVPLVGEQNSPVNVSRLIRSVDP